MDPVTIGLLIGLGAGALKGSKNIRKNAEQDRYRKAAMLYSPWTGMGDVGGGNAPDVFESMLSGGATGALVGNLFPTKTTTTTDTSFLGDDSLSTEKFSGPTGLLSDSPADTPYTYLAQDNLSKDYADMTPEAERSLELKPSEFFKQQQDILPAITPGSNLKKNILQKKKLPPKRVGADDVYFYNIPRYSLMGE